jgi:hypothetical protein
MAWDCCCETAVVRLLSWGCCHEAAVMRLLSWDCCNETAVLRLLVYVYESWIINASWISPEYIVAKHFSWIDFKMKADRMNWSMFQLSLGPPIVGYNAHQSGCISYKNTSFHPQLAYSFWLSMLCCSPHGMSYSIHKQFNPTLQPDIYSKWKLEASWPMSCSFPGQFNPSIQPNVHRKFENEGLMMWPSCSLHGPFNL